MVAIGVAFTTGVRGLISNTLLLTVHKLRRQHLYVALKVAHDAAQ